MLPLKYYIVVKIHEILERDAKQETAMARMNANTKHFGRLPARSACLISAVLVDAAAPGATLPIRASAGAFSFNLAVHLNGNKVRRSFIVVFAPSMAQRVPLGQHPKIPRKFFAPRQHCAAHSHGNSAAPFPVRLPKNNTDARSCVPLAVSANRTGCA